MNKLKSTLQNNKILAQISSAFIAMIFTILLVTSSYDNNINKLISENETVEKQYDESVEKYRWLLNESRQLKQDYDELSQNYKVINNQINLYQDQQATIDDLKTKLTELHGQYDTLLTERDNLQKQLNAQKAEEERIARELEAQQYSNDSWGAVYWVSGGKVYHSTPNCATLKRSSNIHSGSVSDSGKSRACKVCS